MLDPDRPIVIGEQLIDMRTNTKFTVLCSCPKSSPRDYTRRYIEQHRDLFAEPETESEQKREDTQNGNP